MAPAVGGLTELIDSSNGYLVSDTTASSLADAIIKVVNTTYDRDLIAQNARRRWGFDRVGSDLKTLYSSLLEVSD